MGIAHRVSELGRERGEPTRRSQWGVGARWGCEDLLQGGLAREGKGWQSSGWGWPGVGVAGAGGEEGLGEGFHVEAAT